MLSQLWCVTIRAMDDEPILTDDEREIVRRALAGQPENGAARSAFSFAEETCAGFEETALLLQDQPASEARLYLEFWLILAIWLACFGSAVVAWFGIL